MSALRIRNTRARLTERCSEPEGASLPIDNAVHDQLLNKTARIPIAGYEQDHFLSLDVFHQLHCLVCAAGP